METRNIKDFLHLYLGCDTLDTYNDKIGKLVGVSEGEALVKHNTVWGLKHDEVKPTLRPLSDMTEEERKALGVQGICNARGREWTDTIDHALRTRFLLSKGFDLFQLIEAGLAIDKTKLEQNGI